MSDLALSVNTGDYTVHIIVAVDHLGDWDIVDAKRARVDPDQSATDIVDLCETHFPQEWLIDDDNASKVFGPLVATAARRRGVPVPWKMMPMRGQNKETRAASLRGMFKRRKVYMPPTAPFTTWLTKELLTFPNAIGQGVDDGVDALSLLGRRLLAIATPSNVIPIRRLPTTSEMTLDELFEDMPQLSSMRI
jgi:predicted phage terminase large subunit-like protein